MYSLSKLDLMKTDPEQIRVAVRVDDSVNVSRGSAQITLGYKAEDNSIDEAHEFDVQLNSAQLLTPKLVKGMLPGEQVTVMSLVPEDARTMRDLQQRLTRYKAAGGDGEGSFSLHVGDLCLDKEPPAGDIPLTLFLRTQDDAEYIVFSNSELRDLFDKSDKVVDALPFCEKLGVEGD